MIGKIIQAVNQEMTIENTELADFQNLIEASLSGVRQLNLNMSHERWLRLGLHLLGAIRRAHSGEVLPSVDEFVLKQVEADVQDLSRAVLGAAAATAVRQGDVTEVVLLAVHFAAAKQSDSF